MTASRRRLWLVAPLALYLALSAVELTRVLLFERPLHGDRGFFPWEHVVTDERQYREFRWIGAEGTTWRAPAGPVMSLFLFESRPSFPVEGVPIDLTIDGVVFDDLVLRRNEWREVQYYLPPILGAARWSEVESGWQQQAGERARDGWLARWNELKPWRAPAGPPVLPLRIRSGSSFTPVEPVPRGGTPRRLGVAVTDVEWRSLPPEGIGFHPGEIDADGRPFNWTQRWSSLPVQPQGTEMVFSVRSHDPDVATDPLVVDFYWDSEPVLTLPLADHAWTQVRIPLGTAMRPGVLSTRVDRTWNPSARGISVDDRDLGLGISAIEWR